mgnify:CR=1 FL=1
MTLQRVQASVWRDLVKKHGRPGGLHAMENGFAIIGYGKLGGIELGYGSDLDLVFIESGGDNLSATFSPELADVTVYFQNAPSSGFLNLSGPDGLLASVDASTLANASELTFPFVLLPATGMGVPLTASFTSAPGEDGRSPAAVSWGMAARSRKKADTR